MKVIVIFYPFNTVSQNYLFFHFELISRKFFEYNGPTIACCQLVIQKTAKIDRDFSKFSRKLLFLIRIK